MIKRRIGNKGDISAQEIEKAYRKAFNVPLVNIIKRIVLKVFGLNSLSLPFLFADNCYKTASFHIIKQILKETKEKFGCWVYKEEEADCDDATFWLMGVFHQDPRTVGMPIYITWVGTPEGGHAILSFYFSGTVYIIEPQDYTTFFVPKDWKLWALIG